MAASPCNVPRRGLPRRVWHGRTRAWHDAEAGSAITTLVLEEPETGFLQVRVQGHLLASGRVAVVEVTKAVAHANPLADAQAVFALLSFVELDADLARVVAAPGGAGLRALEGIHVASALRLGSEVEAFATYDSRQAAVAHAIGLRVEAPGAPLSESA